MKDAFPSDTKKNPKDCMAVQLRSGKELEKEKSEKNEGNKGEGSLEKREKEALKMLSHWRKKGRRSSNKKKKEARRKPRTLCLQSHSRRDCKSQR